MKDYTIAYHVLFSKISMAMIDVEVSMLHVYNMAELWRKDHGEALPRERLDAMIKNEVEIIERKVGII